MRHRLRVIQPTLDRRELLVLGVSGAVAACGAEPVRVPPPSTTADAAAHDDAAASADDAAASAADARTSADDAGLGADDARASADDAAMTSAPDAQAADDAGATAPDAASPPDATSPPDAGAVVPPPAGFVRIGATRDFPLDRWVSAAGGGRAYIVGHDAAGVFIYSATCTHASCLVPPPAGPGRNSVCPCHMSIFDSNGARVSGPARTALAHYAAFVSGADLYVHPNMTVAAGTRTPVP